MIKEMLIYLVITASFLLLFFVMAALVEPYKERLVQLFKKNSWKTARTFFYIWIGILVLRKLVYYIQFNGVIQTPDSVWWVDKEELISVYAVFMALLFFRLGSGLMTRSRTLLYKRNLSDLIFNLGIIFVVFSVFALGAFFVSLYELSIIRMIFSPLLMLKMVCSGKYLGLITGFALVYYIHKYRNLEPGIHRDYIRFLAVTGLILMGSGIFTFYKLPGDWEKRFLEKAQTAKNERAIEDLLDAANTIRDHKQRVEILKKIVVNAGGAGNIKLTNHICQQYIETAVKPGRSDYAKMKSLEEILEIIVMVKQKGIKLNKEIFQGAIHVVRTIKTAGHKSNIVKKIILTIVKIGEVEADKELCQQAIDVIQTMHVKYRFRLFKEITAAVAKTANKEWARVIFLQLINAVESITNNGWFRYDLIREVLQTVTSREDMKGETAIFTAAIDAANNISYWRNKSLALQAIASSLAKTGYLQWAEAVARSIPDTEIKSNTLTEIRGKIEQKEKGD